MTKTKPKILLCLILLCCLVSIWLLLSGFHRMQAAYNELSFLANNEYVWVFHLIFNCMGYATIFVPGYILYKFVRKTDVLNRLESTNLGKALYVCFGEYQRLPETMPKVKVDDEVERTPSNECASLAICFCGLMGSYLTWGLLQEKIMTQTYLSADGMRSHFRDSQFLVFANRVSALVLSATWLATRRKHTSVGPLYPFSYCSLSNVLSAWCQYEALKYISFPTQVLSKACKIIPVMVMGRLVSGNKYEPYEYATAALLSAGMGLFMLGASDDYVASRVTTFSGMILLGGYLAADSFTSSWQAALFRARPALTPAHMMCLVNLFSCALTSISLAQQGSFQHSFHFMAQHPSMVWDVVLLSCSSAVGQLFIFHTIARFGAVVFTVIMTVRQAVAILISCMVYGHQVSAAGICGVLLVFLSVLLRVYCKQRIHSARRRAADV